MELNKKKKNKKKKDETVIIKNKEEPDQTFVLTAQEYSKFKMLLENDQDKDVKNSEKIQVR